MLHCKIITPMFINGEPFCADDCPLYTKKCKHRKLDDSQERMCIPYIEMYEGEDNDE